MPHVEDFVGTQQRAARKALAVPKISRSMHPAPPRAARVRPGYNPYANVPNVSARPAPNEKGFKPIKTGPMPLLGYSNKQIGRNVASRQQLAREYARVHGRSMVAPVPRNLKPGAQLSHIEKQYQQEQARLAAMVDPVSRENLNFDKTFLKGLAPQTLIALAHGHLPTGRQAGTDALFFLPWSRALRASAEALSAAHGAESGVRAAEAAGAARESYKAGRGVVGGLAGAGKKLLPSERALAASPARKELFAHFDATLEPKIAQANKQLFDKAVKAGARNQGVSVHEMANKLIHVRSEIAPHELPQELKHLYQHDALPVPHMPDQLDAKAIAKEIRATHKDQLPPQLRKPGALERAINRTYEHVKLGAGYRDWYKRYAGVMAKTAEHSTLGHVSPRQVAQLMAVYSQRANPTENFRRAITSALQHGDFKVFAGQAEKAKKIVQDPTWFETHYLPSQDGPKISNYYANALEHLDPQHYERLFGGTGSHVTVDTHMNRMLLGSDRVDNKHYDALAQVFRVMGKHLGWDPAEVQAASWVSKKAANQAESVAKKLTAKGVEFAQRPASEYLHSSGDAYERAYEKYSGTLFQEAEKHAMTPERLAAVNKRVANLTRLNKQGMVRNTYTEALDKLQEQGAISWAEHDEMQLRRELQDRSLTEADVRDLLKHNPQYSGLVANSDYGHLLRGGPGSNDVLFQQADHHLPHDTFNPHVAQVTSEANPDPKLWPELRSSYDKLPPDQKVAYGQAMDKAVAGRFEHILGLDHLGNREGLGIWRGAGEHGVASHILVGHGPISPELRSNMDALTAAQGIAKHQNSVSWGRPVPPAEGDFHGVHWTPPAGTDPVAASAALDQLAGEGNVGFIHAPDGGFYVINFAGDQGSNFAIRRLGGEQTDIGWQGGYTIDNRIATPADQAAGAVTFQDAIGNNPKGGQIMAELAKIRAETEPIQAHFLGTPTAKIVTHEEAQMLGDAGTHVFHGTTGLNAEQIMAERTLRVGHDSHPEAAWVTQDPSQASWYADTGWYDQNLGKEPGIVAIPRERIPMGAGNAKHPFGAIGNKEDVLFQKTEAGPYDHLTTEQLHARADAINARYEAVLKELTAREGRPGDYKRLTAYQNAVSKKMVRRTGKPYPTVTEQFRSIAEKKLEKFLADHADHPLVKEFNADQAEANAIRQEIYRRNDALFQKGHLGTRALDKIASYGHSEPVDLMPPEDMARYGFTNANWHAHGINPQAAGADELFRAAARKIANATGRDPAQVEQMLREGDAQAQKTGGVIKGAFDPQGAHGAIIHLTQAADVTTFPHELGHFLRRYGLNAAHEARLAEWAGVKNGVWDRQAEEKFARGLEKMIRQGDAPNNMVEEFRRLEPLFREVYPTADKLPSVPADVAQVYKEILGHRDGPQALYWALHNRLVTHQLANEARQGDVRTPEAARQHFLEADQLAKEEGFGRALPKVQRLGKDETSVETGGKAGLELRRGMQDVGKLRNEQEAIREVQRYRKAGQLRNAQKVALKAEHPSLALTEAGGTRAGQLEHSNFEGFHGLRDYMDELATHLVQHPHLRPHEVQNAWEAILNGLDGQVPRKYEQKLLERAFGKQADSIATQLKNGTLGEKVANVMNVPRSLMASGDLSAPFRQGLVVAASHPGVFLEGMGQMLKAAKSEKTFQEAMQGLHSMDGYAYAEKSGLSITEIGDAIGAREEQFASNLAEHLHELPGVRSTPGVKHVAKGASTIVRGSDRAYVLFLNHVRMRLFNLLTQQAAEEGYHLSDKLGADIAKFVNSATGRGDLGMLKDHAATLNTMFFSPRLMKSRFDFLNPHWYMTMEPFARREALKGALRLAGTLSTILLFARAAGATVVADPRNADFGKIRIGNTRIDLAGGFTQPIRLVAQLYTGQIVSSQTGRLENLTSSGFGRSRLDVASQFLENKFAPVPSTIVDLLRGSQFGGQPITAQSEIAQHMVPLLWQDMANVYHSTGAKGLAAYGPLDLFGVGIQNYGAPGPKTARDTNKLLKDSIAAGLGKPPAAVQNDVQWKAKLDAATYAGMDPYKRAEAAVKLYDQRYNTHLETSVLPKLTTEGQAEALYQEVRSRLFPSLSHWQSAVDKVLRAKASQKPTPQAQQQQSDKRSAPAPLPTVTDAQDVSYHPPAPATHGVDAAQHTIVSGGGHTDMIASAARAHGLDPQAVLAVASQEGLSGGVGDGGTSFGPFQLHAGGALPAEVWAKGAAYAQRWAWSPEGINYALSHMAGVAKGLHGQAAVSAIVRGFERPANPSGEIAGAMGAYGGHFSAGPMVASGGGNAATGNDLTRAADAALEMLASGTYSPMRMLSVLSSQPLKNTVEVPGFGHVRFQIPKFTGPVGRAARGAIALAQAFLGTPYVWGGESPKGFDCSGLLQYIYAKQGVNIPRTSEQQFHAGTPVPKSQLRPGDAVFFEPGPGGPGHVGIYIGHGKFIESPHTGATVRISNLAGYPGYVGARRYARARGRRAA